MCVSFDTDCSSPMNWAFYTFIYMFKWLFQTLDSSYPPRSRPSPHQARVQWYHPAPTPLSPHPTPQHKPLCHWDAVHNSIGYLHTGQSVNWAPFKKTCLITLLWFYTPRLWRVGCNVFDFVCLCVCYHSHDWTERRTDLNFGMEVKRKDI